VIKEQDIRAALRDKLYKLRIAGALGIESQSELWAYLTLFGKVEALYMVIQETRPKDLWTPLEEYWQKKMKEMDERQESMIKEQNIRAILRDWLNSLRTVAAKGIESEIEAWNYHNLLGKVDALYIVLQQERPEDLYAPLELFWINKTKEVQDGNAK
jgi:hypothetical protein